MSPCINVGNQSELIEEVVRVRMKTGKNRRAERFGRTNREAHTLGVMGEVAAALYYGVLDEWESRNPYKGSDPGYDIEFRGFTLQIKAKDLDEGDPWLIYDPELHVSCNAYLLARVDVEKSLVYLAGWAKTAELHNSPHSHNIHGTVCQYLRLDELRACVRPESEEDGGVEEYVEPYAHVPVGPGVPVKEKPERDMWEGYEWPQLALECERKFGCEVARLYPYVGDVKPPLHPRYGTPMQRTNRVRTPRGGGLLLQANAGSCMVLMDAEEARAATEKAKAEAEAKREKKRRKKARYGVELPAGTRFHEREVVPE